MLLCMGMPTTTAYVLAASVIAPGLVKLEIKPLTALFSIFYFAVMSATTPPVALAAKAGAAPAGSDPARTSVKSFRFGLTAFVVPDMFFFPDSLLLQGIGWKRPTSSPLSGIYLLSSGIIGWFFGPIDGRRGSWWSAALPMLDEGLATDRGGLVIGAGLFGVQWRRAPVAGGRASEEG